ncbi:complex I assembly factor TIMMDC1, mitochondrial isoform X2 [Ambystoma mexicanum]
MGVPDRHLLLGVAQRLNPIPRVFAEDAHPRSLDGLPLPGCISGPLPPESGWDRIRELFYRDDMQGYPEELTNLWKGTITAGFIGFLYGGVPAARHARERFIEQSQAEVFRHRIEAVRAAHNAALRGFIRYGWRWGWRVAAFVTIFNGVSTGLAVYRDKNSFGHFAAAGAVTGGLFRLNLGLRGMVGGSAIGMMLGAPIGAVMTVMQMAAGETLRERKRREQRERYELKLQEWAARLDVTQGALEEVSIAGPSFSSEMDAQKIEELLSLPRNPGVLQPHEDE